tara:strand:+ start:321 stop:452 length:132 start_codon:yes stop_codon:yes gene_type:complete
VDQVDQGVVVVYVDQVVVQPILLLKQEILETQVVVELQVQVQQ